MHCRFTTSSGGSKDTTAAQLIGSFPKASSTLRIIRVFIVFWPALFTLVSCSTAVKAANVLPGSLPANGSPTSPPSAPEQNVQYQAALIRDNLSAYLDFVGSRVLPVMSNNIDEILHKLNGLTDIRPGFFYHGHIDYSIGVSGGIGGLMDMNNVILQYHTLENPLLYLPYWRAELRKAGDQNINGWLDRVDEYNQVLNTSSSASEARYVPLVEAEAAHIASSWEDYRVQNGLASPGPEMLKNMVYLIDGGRQPRYQESFRMINRFHSIAFGPEGFIPLENRTHLENTFSPLQINFEYIGNCRELLPVFDEASAAGFKSILNLKNSYVAQHSDLMHDPAMAKLSRELNLAIRRLPDDNLIKISDTPDDQQIAFLAVGNYIFAIYGSLDSPPMFK